VALTSTPTFFQGFTPEELARLLAELDSRPFPAGAVILKEGECPAEMYVVQRGYADLLVADRHGVDHKVGQIGPGATIGEMALFADQPAMVNAASATVRARTELDVVAIDAPTFYRVAAAFPKLLHNVGAMLSQRLARSYQQAVAAQQGRVAVLVDHDAPPLLGYALASSVAWHARRNVVLVVVSAQPHPDLVRLATVDLTDETSEFGAIDALAALVPGDRGARLVLAPPSGEFSSAALDGTVQVLSERFDHVLVQLPGEVPSELDAMRIHLGAASYRSSQEGLLVRAWSATAARRPDRQGVLEVPALNAADEAALRGGLLPAGSDAGRALGWVARHVAGLKVGLAFGSGSVKGYAHYGVWAALERIGLAADYVTGTSIGAIVAATYALDFTADEAARNMEETSHRAFRLTVPRHAMLSNAGVHANFRQVAGDKRFEDLELPLAMVAADLTTGHEVVLRRGLLRTAALASMAIPGVYPPLRMGPYTLVDGGVVNPVPISVTAEMGADVVIGVNLGKWVAQPMAEVESREEVGPLPSLLQTVLRAVEVMQGRIASHAVATASVLVEPDFAGIPDPGLRAFHRGRAYIPAGEAALEAAMPRLQSALPWLRP
jgi:NTE family protein